MSLETRLQALITAIGADIKALQLAGGAPFSAVIGDGVEKVFVVTHGRGTRAIRVAVQREAEPWDLVPHIAQATTDNTATIELASPPAVDALRVLVWS